MLHVADTCTIVGSNLLFYFRPQVPKRFTQGRRGPYNLQDLFKGRQSTSTTSESQSFELIVLVGIIRPVVSAFSSLGTREDDHFSSWYPLSSQ